MPAIFPAQGEIAAIVNYFFEGSGINAVIWISDRCTTSMDKTKITNDTWDKLASLYQEKFMDLDLYNDTYTIFCNLITESPAKVLDIGCGPGNITRFLFSKRPDFQIEGIDVAPNMVKLAQRNNPTASFRVMDCKNVGGIKERFHGIISGFCLPYLSQEECGKLIADAYNLLSDDGVLYFSFVEGDPRDSGFKTSSTGDSVYFNYHLLEDIVQ